MYTLTRSNVQSAPASVEESPSQWDADVVGQLPPEIQRELSQHRRMRKSGHGKESALPKGVLATLCVLSLTSPIPLCK